MVDLVYLLVAAVGALGVAGVAYALRHRRGAPPPETPEDRAARKRVARAILSTHWLQATDPKPGEPPRLMAPAYNILDEARSARFAQLEREALAPLFSHPSFRKIVNDVLRGTPVPDPGRGVVMDKAVTEKIATAEVVGMLTDRGMVLVPFEYLREWNRIRRLLIESDDEECIAVFDVVIGMEGARLATTSAAALGRLSESDFATWCSIQGEAGIAALEYPTDASEPMIDEDRDDALGVGMEAIAAGLPENLRAAFEADRAACEDPAAARRWVRRLLAGAEALPNPLQERFLRALASRPRGPAPPTPTSAPFR